MDEFDNNDILPQTAEVTTLLPLNAVTFDPEQSESIDFVIPENASKQWLRNHIVALFEGFKEQDYSALLEDLYNIHEMNYMPLFPEKYNPSVKVAIPDRTSMLNYLDSATLAGYNLYNVISEFITDGPTPNIKKALVNFKPVSAKLESSFGISNSPEILRASIKSENGSEETLCFLPVPVRITRIETEYRIAEYSVNQVIEIASVYSLRHISAPGHPREHSVYKLYNNVLTACSFSDGTKQIVREHSKARQLAEKRNEVLRKWNIEHPFYSAFGQGKRS